MTATGIYGLVWLFAITVTAAFYFVGLVNEVTFLIFGFVYSALAVMGFVAVLPVWLNEYHAPESYTVRKSRLK
jgi:hypothetical protein